MSSTTARIIDERNGRLDVEYEGRVWTLDPVDMLMRREPEHFERVPRSGFVTASLEVTKRVLESLHLWGAR